MTEEITPLEIPAVTLDKSKLDYNNKTSLWYLNEKQFSGYAVTYFQDSMLMQKIGILDGKKQNIATDWYPDGEVKHSANYHLGKLQGEKKSWSPDSTHILISHLNYHLGKAHGVQKKWYSTGEIFKILNLEMGKEEGIQQAFRKNGDLFANYEARDGRIFGLKRAALCFGLEDQKIQYSK
ncbi:MAG: toxin-antitoxin system YwqK family antitoxin [Saprospiraceae bacterium]